MTRETAEQNDVSYGIVQFAMLLPNHPQLLLLRARDNFLQAPLCSRLEHNLLSVLVTLPLLLQQRIVFPKVWSLNTWTHILNDAVLHFPLPTFANPDIITHVIDSESLFDVFQGIFMPLRACNPT